MKSFLSRDRKIVTSQVAVSLLQAVPLFISCRNGEFSAQIQRICLAQDERKPSYPQKRLLAVFYFSSKYSTVHL
ncbi:hypothetical protein [Chlorogloeopsis fritschii]|uniref:hypothetical protein n=1 Tax=Chlorogloeopsis fritschii TaxID=1124 RepID=UPI00058E2920|nr:hypothetical protein [Chlorogloeopsis fritschii]